MTIVDALTLAEEKRAREEGENSRGIDLSDREEMSDPNIRINRYKGDEPNVQFIGDNYCANGVVSEKLGRLCLANSTIRGYCPHREDDVVIKEGKLAILHPCEGCSFVPYEPIIKELQRRAEPRPIDE